jgi:hypothetical protein
MMHESSVLGLVILFAGLESNHWQYAGGDSSGLYRLFSHDEGTGVSAGGKSPL